MLAPWRDSAVPCARVCILCGAAMEGKTAKVPSRARLLELAAAQPGVERRRGKWTYCPGPGRRIRISERDALALGGQVVLESRAPRLMGRNAISDWAESILLMEE